MAMSKAELIARIAELETQLIIAERLSYIEAGKINLVLTRCDEIGRMLTGLKKAVRDSR